MRMGAKTCIATAVLLAATLTGCAVVNGFLEGGREGGLQGALQGAASASAEIIAKSAIESLQEGKVAEEYTADQQYYIGRGVSAVVLSKFEPVFDDNDQHSQQLTYVNEMGGYIREASMNVTRDGEKLGGYVSRDEAGQKRVQDLYLFHGLHVGILDTDEVTAFSTPGGFIWISRGSINMCRNEDELAAVICHELGHVVMDHGMDNYREANNNQITDNPFFKNTFDDGSGTAGNFGNLIGGFFDDLIDSGYGKDQEFEADSWGTRALAAAGYAPNAMVEMLESVEAYEKAHGDKSGSYLSQHPAAKDRIAKVKDLIKKEKLTASSVSMTPEGVRDRHMRFEKAFK